MSLSWIPLLPHIIQALTGRRPSVQRGTDDKTQSYRYDVFISFRGPDTRNTFVDHLYSHLIRKGIFTFKDDKQLQKGESISPQLLQAIQHSRCSIIVFSKDYASSTWCLDEMAAIADCRAKFKQIVFPVFYDVDPSHVRNQNGVFENAFVLHTEKFKDDPHKVDGWKRAMTCFAGLTGWDVRNKQEVEEIENIVQTVIEKLGHKFSGYADDLIGIQPQVRALEKLLKLSSHDDRCLVLGIWGMDGIGKTTLATVLYDTISHHYQFGACCFIENVSTIYREDGAIAVQKQILHQTLKEKNLDAYSRSEISGIIINRLKNIKVLIVLDDVDSFVQLQELHLNPRLLHPESRIIITTIDLNILELYGADKIHKVELMNYIDARKLLCRKAFQSDNSSSDYAELIPKVLEYAQGLPLAIRVMGSFLFNRDTKKWRATLDGLEKNPNSGTMKVLQSSFEGLENREREIFLHVACFFEGEREDYVRRILHACELQPDIGISLIVEKSFITIRNQEIHMHKILQELGKQIVRKEHPDEPRLWSRLWLYRDLNDAIRKLKAIKAKAIILNQMEDVSKFKQLRDEDLSKMENLKLLILNQSKFSGSSKFLSDSLCYLLWNGCPLTCLPSNFQPYNLVELNMPDSSIVQLWEEIQDLPNLKRMELSNSKNLKVTPRFEGMQNLERLDLTGCINLSVVHPSIGLLTKLEFLSLQNCTSLVTLVFRYAPRLMSLRVLSLSGCTKLENTLNFTELSNLQYLDMDRCASLSTIHESVEALEELTFLSLRECTNLVGIPDGLNNMTSLTTLDLYGCLKFTNLPLRVVNDHSSLESLIFLDLSFCNISKVPKDIGKLRCLERLNLQGNKFTELPSSLSWLDNLSYLNLSHCHKLQSLRYLPKRSGQSNSAGRYFKTTSESRNHRSGLYVFDSPNCTQCRFFVNALIQRWILTMFEEPLSFRCGFDIVLPWYKNTSDSVGNHFISIFFHHRFEGGSIVRINDPVMDVCLGFLFYVTFELNNHPVLSSSSHQSLSSSLPHPFYLSFESEYTEERFDMPLNLELNKIDGLNYIWVIYISQEHCHFVKTGAHITFKARQGLIIKEWGLLPLTKINTEEGGEIEFDAPSLSLENVNIKQRSSGSSCMPKIQFPYNWFVSDKDEAERDEAKGKETDLFNLGLLTESSQLL
ncbi:disease resistance protein RUN1-like isoform X1 [Trifolium pratense]|uniref:disease resistance protein RUN1-like isoform X1 n=1 Tax=Trifolium pratense TaxID=57577 RepID=UPI001E694813|nr:disease resistance protein RUN1-like isoform X1 [Trifolium pratense]XP_045798934.1 disease resistance protein RUN1-like isoform X1 [Trifolium pratense]